MQHEFNEKEYWNEIHALNDKHVMEQLTERYMKENFKYVKTKVPLTDADKLLGD